jgi:hypothetical protein
MVCCEPWKPCENPIELSYDCIQEILRFTDWSSELRLKYVNKHFHQCVDLDRQKTWRRATRWFKKQYEFQKDKATGLMNDNVLIQQRLDQVNYRNSMLQQQLDWDGSKIHSYD